MNIFSFCSKYNIYPYLSHGCGVCLSYAYFQLVLASHLGYFTLIQEL
jgi:hypothetical protein